MPEGLTTELLADQQCIGPSELGKLLGRSTKYIKKDASTRPYTLPPRFQPPGTRKLVWRVADVLEWMEAIAAEHKREREAAVAAMKKVGLNVHIPTRAFVLGQKALGTRARAAMEEGTEAPGPTPPVADRPITSPALQALASGLNLVQQGDREHAAQMPVRRYIGGKLVTEVPRV